MAATRIAFASLQVLGEAIRRRWGDDVLRQQEEWRNEVGKDLGAGERPIDLGDLIYGIGRGIENRTAAMVEADAGVVQARWRQRTSCDRRDDGKQNLYKGLSRFRNRARSALGRLHARRCPPVRGETLRDPKLLVRQTEDCLRWTWEDPTLAAEAARLEPLRDDLEAARRQAVDAGSGVTVARDGRRRAIAAFDDHYLKGTRFLERLYVILGMPSLADEVRPHLVVTARVGRPSNRPDVDEHPDLVERALAVAWDYRRS